jgi:hypothetical protein
MMTLTPSSAGCHSFRPPCLERRMARTTFSTWLWLQAALTLVLLLLVDLSHAKANVVNLNLKSARLENSLRTENTKDSVPPPATPTTITSPSSSSSKKNLIQLDLSGTAELFLRGPSPVDEDAAHPMFVSSSLSSTRPRQPFILATAEYNFHQKWYGLTRLGSIFRWKTKTTAMREGNPFLPKRVDCKADTDLASSLAIETTGLVLDWNADQHERNRPSLEIKLDHGLGVARLGSFLPLHRRLDVRLQSHGIWRRHQKQATGFFSPTSKHIREHLDWWIPDLSMNTMGQVSSQNQVHGNVGRSHESSRLVEVRLVLRRNLSFTGMETAETQLQLQASMMGPAQDSVTTARIETILESMVPSTRLVLEHEHAFELSNSKF